MVSQQVIEGRWNEIKGMLRSHWGQLTDDDLTSAKGHVDQLIGTIQRKTGEGRDVIERYLNEISDSGASAVGQAVEGVRQFSRQAADFSRHAADTMQSTARQAADQVRSGYGQAERMVRQRPGESLAICFGVGVLTGVLVSMLIGSSRG